MSITFACEHCGQQLTVDDSLAGKHGRCKHCGQGMDVPSAGFRLEPLSEAETAGADVARRPAPGKPSPAARKTRGERVKLAPVEKASDAGGIPEEFLADRAPYEIDQDFEPPRSAVSPSTVPILMEARAGWRHTVRAFLGKLSKFEDAIYLILMVFWLIGAAAFLFELKPLAWSMLGALVISSILLLLLGGLEIFVKPFQESLRHGLAFVFVPPYAIYYVATRWKQMKRPFRKAIGAFGPLIVLLLLALFSRPIRDWFLHTPPKKSETETSSAQGRDIGVPVHLVQRIGR
jgi:hypothetical protein